jgi:glycosyltransferase involved in cell wall biosynthesis
VSVECSVVIATRDRCRALTRALETLAQQENAPPFEVIVVDNGSTDATRKAVERAAASARLSPERGTVRYRYEPQANRGAARNRGVAAATGTFILFCDDDVRVPRGWVAAHIAAQTGNDDVVNGPIVNVTDSAAEPKPRFANYSRAFLCTCNVSLPKAAFERCGGFDERFDLYGWEDTELGVRLREGGARWRFAWDAYLWHIKSPAEAPLEVEARKAVEKARMARRFLEKHPSRRARMATGAHAVNLLRARYFLPEGYVALCAGIAADEKTPGWLRAVARGQFLDAVYARELVRAADG